MIASSNSTAPTKQASSIYQLLKTSEGPVAYHGGYIFEGSKKENYIGGRFVCWGGGKARLLSWACRSHQSASSAMIGSTARLFPMCLYLAAFLIPLPALSLRRDLGIVGAIQTAQQGFGRREIEVCGISIHQVPTKRLGIDVRLPVQKDGG